MSLQILSTNWHLFFLRCSKRDEFEEDYLRIPTQFLVALCSFWERKFMAGETTRGATQNGRPSPRTGDRIDTRTKHRTRALP